MSRVGNKAISIPAGVTVVIGDGSVSVKGPKGELRQAMPAGVSAVVEGSVLQFSRESEGPKVRALHGLARALVANMVKGVSAGFERRLELQGIGYKAEMKGATLVMNLGFSHPIEFPAPEGVGLRVDGGTKVVVSGVDRQVVGQAAAKIRSFRPPDSYKGKGVRYAGERVRLKAGKSQ